MRVSVITVTWNSKEYILRQIESVKKAARAIQIEQIIIDNNSTDGTVEAIQSKFPEVTVIANTENKGFAVANNQGVHVSKGNYLLFLNPDMKLEEGSLDILVGWMDVQLEVGIVAPRLLDAAGQLNLHALPRRFPRVFEQVALMLKIPHMFPSILDGYHLKGFDSMKEQEVDSVRGSCMLMRRSLVDKLGFAFDRRYFIWYEDVDICREAKKMGYKVMHTPVIAAVDYVGESFRKRPGVWKQIQFTKSMLVYFQKWEPWWKWMWIALFRPAGIVLAFARSTVEKDAV